MDISNGAKAWTFLMGFDSPNCGISPLTEILRIFGGDRPRVLRNTAQ